MFSKVEIAICTYNRSEILCEWINKSIDDLRRFNIKLSVYDSSYNDETEQLINNINKQYDGSIEIKYNRIDGSIRLDEKVLMSILNAEREYVWPIGDSRLCDFVAIESYVNEAINEKLDYIGMYIDSNESNGKCFNSIVDYFKEFFWCSTLLGGMIFRKEIFNDLNNQNTLNMFLSKYNKNDGFSYLGIFYEIAFLNKCKGMYIVHQFRDMSVNKNPAWLKRYFEVWCENMCYLFDCLPQDFQCCTQDVLYDSWQKINLDGWYWLIRARINDGLNRMVLHKYSSNKMLQRVSKHIARVKFVANMPVWCARLCMKLYEVKKKIKCN